MRKSKFMILTFVISGLILILIGSSFSLYNYSKTGSFITNANTISPITFHYDDKNISGNGIALSEALPVADNIAIVQKEEGTYFDFTINSKSYNANVPYVVTARKVGDSGNVDDIIKLYLTEVKIVNNEEVETSVFGGVHLFSELTPYTQLNNPNERVIYTDTVLPTGNQYERKFRLRFWIDENADLSEGYNNQAFRIQVNVYAKAIDSDMLLRNSYANQESFIDYYDSENTLLNPDRGLYRPVAIKIDPTTGLFITTLGNSIDFETKQSIRDSMSILHLRINICELSGNCNSSGEDKNFTDAQLNSLNNMLDNIRKNGGKVIIRFFYDDSGVTGMEPKSFDTILSHVDQLSTVFNKNKDIITTVEAGFIGPWGEMHTSDYAEDNYVRSLVLALLDSVPSNLTVNVRTPHHYIATFGSLNSNSEGASRVGIFNDGYLGSASDLGTFTEETSRESFVNWMKEKGKTTFYGGEVTKFGVNDDGYNPADEQYSEGSFAISEMPNTHTNYFNSQFNLNILNTKWKNQTYTSDSEEYSSVTYYKYIIDHLGYRFVLRDSDITVAAKQGTKAAVKFTLDNVGFGNVIQNYDVKLILLNGLDYYEAKLNTDIRTLYGGEDEDYEFFFNVPSDITPGYWDVYLKIVNPLNNTSAIRFANPNIYHEDLMANKLGKINIMESESSGVIFKQADEPSAPDGEKKVLTPKLVYVPVSFSYIDYGNNFATISSQLQVSIPIGTEIDFRNPTQLEQLGIELPEGYRFVQVSSEFVGWASGLKKITIPNNPNASAYWVNVYLTEVTIPTIEFIYLDQGNSNTEITRLQIPVARGTTIDFTDSTQLAELEITFPQGYTYSHVSSALVNWAYAQSITIPEDGIDNMYWINIYMNPMLPPTVEFIYLDKADNHELSRHQSQIERGTTIDFTDSSQLTSLGISAPNGYKISHAACGFSGNWAATNSITIPVDYNTSNYWINVYVSEDSAPTIEFIYADRALPSGENILSRQQVPIPRGTTIDITDSVQLSNLGINIPYNYRVAFAQAAFTDPAWSNVTEFTIPANGSDSMYWISIYLDEITIPRVEIAFIDKADNSMISRLYTYIERGITIDFSNKTLLNSLDITLPTGYLYSHASCGFTDPAWQAVQTVTIPSAIGTNNYYIEVYMDEIHIPLIEVVYHDQTNSTTLETKQVYLDRDTTIDFRDAVNLNTIDLSIPTGYLFDYASCAFTDTAWEHVQTITIPSNLAVSYYYIDVYVNQILEPTLELVYRNRANNNIFDRTYVTVERGLTIDFGDLTQMTGLGVTYPSGYIYHHIGCAFAGDPVWSATQTATIPSDLAQNHYYVEVYMDLIVDPTIEFVYINAYDNSTISSQSIDIARGTTIDFTDSSQITSLGLVYPSHFIYSHVACGFTNPAWASVQSVTIPSDVTVNYYAIQVYLNEVLTPTLEIVYRDLNNNDSNTNVISRQTIDIDRETVIDFSDSSSLTTLGITPPNSYLFRHILCGFSNPAWSQVQTVTIPADLSTNHYYMDVYMTEILTPSVEFVYRDKVDNSIISRETVNIARETVIDFTSSTQLTTLGLTLPSGYLFSHAACAFTNPAWASVQTVTIPADLTVNSYYIDVYMDNVSRPAVEFIYLNASDNSEISRERKNVLRGTTIDFSDQTQITSLGYTYPSGHTYSHASSAIVNWAAVQTITIPNNEQTLVYYINIYMN